MNYLIVAAAGFLGAISRKIISSTVLLGFLPGIPVNTLFINTTGCFILSLFMTVTADRYKVDPRLRLAFGTGFLGAYTTFSTFSVEILNLIQSGKVVNALIYMFITPAGCLLFAWAGSAAGKFINRPASEVRERESAE